MTPAAHNRDTPAIIGPPCPDFGVDHLGLKGPIIVVQDRLGHGERVDVLGTYVDRCPRRVPNLQMVQTDETPVSPRGADLEFQHKAAGMERANKILLDPRRRMNDRELLQRGEFRQTGGGLDHGNVLRVVEEGNARRHANQQLRVLPEKGKPWNPRR